MKARVCPQPLVGALAHCRPALSLADRVLFPALPDRAEDQPVADRDRAAALHADARSCGRMVGASKPFSESCRFRPMRLLGSRRHLSSVLSQKPADRRAVDARSRRDRATDRLRHGARAGPRPADPPGRGDSSVLDLVSDPRLCLDQHPAARRPAQRRAARARPHRGAGRLACERHRRLYRHRLFLPAFHGAAALRQFPEARRKPARSGCRSRLSALENLLSRNVAARPARPRRRRAAMLHPDHRRVRHSRSSRRLANPDDRPDLWTEFFANRDWPVASAIAVVLLALLVVPIAFYENVHSRQIEGR